MSHETRMQRLCKSADVISGYTSAEIDVTRTKIMRDIGMMNDCSDADLVLMAAKHNEKVRTCASKVICCLVFLFMSVVACAETWTDPETGYTWTYRVVDSAAALTGVEPAAGDIVIPVNVGDYPVKQLGLAYNDGWYTIMTFLDRNSDVTGLIIPEGVERITKDAIYLCDNLSSIWIPSTLKSTVVAFAGWGKGVREIHAVDIKSYCNIEWQITGYLNHMSEEKISLFTNDVIVTKLHIPEGVKNIRDSAFYNMQDIVEVFIPDSVTNIQGRAFQHCSGIRKITVGKGCAMIGPAFYGCNSIKEAIFNCDVPAGFDQCYIDISKTHVFPARAYGKSWISHLGLANFYGFADGDMDATVEIVSTKMRASDPTIMDVEYVVHSDKERVRVRALAFEDGVQSFAKIVRAVTFTEDTKANVGDDVAANATNRLSWQVAADWRTELSQVAFSVIAVKDSILPLELQTIPRTDSHEAMTFSWNCIDSENIMKALYWLVADGDEGLVVVNGVLKTAAGGTVLANGATLSNQEAALRYIYGKMGYEKLAGEDLEYVNTASRLGLDPSGGRQYAVKKGVNNKGE